MWLWTGALDLAIWDEDLDGGSYWGLVRIDAGSEGGHGHRRTGRFTSKDFVNFTAAEQVFEGPSDDYQIYTVQPFRLPAWTPGQYLATAMFFSAQEPQGWVHCELLQTLNWGQNWTRLAPNQQFIPLGVPGATGNVSWRAVPGLKENDCANSSGGASGFAVGRGAAARTTHEICDSHAPRSSAEADTLAKCQAACVAASEECAVLQFQEGKTAESGNQCFLYGSCANHTSYSSPSDGRDWCFHILAKHVTGNANTNPFDSHTLYTAWSGKQGPLLNPKAENETLFYYAGGNGPHTGQRDDSIGLATATTHAYAGLRTSANTNVATLQTEPLSFSSASTPGACGFSVLVGIPDDKAAIGKIRVGLALSADGGGSMEELALPERTSAPTWTSLPDRIVRQMMVPGPTPGLRFQLVNSSATLFAIRAD